MTKDRNKITVLIDMRYYKIRIHKKLLHLLGDPEYIRLLINPKTKILAIKAVPYAKTGDSIHKIGKLISDPHRTVEITSCPLLKELKYINGEIEDGKTYYLYGIVIASEQMAVLSLEDATRIK